MLPAYNYVICMQHMLMAVPVNSETADCRPIDSDSKRKTCIFFGIYQVGLATALLGDPDHGTNTTSEQLSNCEKSKACAQPKSTSTTRSKAYTIRSLLPHVPSVMGAAATEPQGTFATAGM